MGKRLLTLRAGGIRSSPASPAAKTFTPQFPDPSPLAVFSRLPMELGRVMVAYSSLLRRCKPLLLSKKLWLIESSPGIQPSQIGQPPGVAGLMEISELLYRTLHL